MHVSVCNNTVLPFVYFPKWFLKIRLLKLPGGEPYLYSVENRVSCQVFIIRIEVFYTLLFSNLCLNNKKAYVWWK